MKSSQNTIILVLSLDSEQGSAVCADKQVVYPQPGGLP